MSHRTARTKITVWGRASSLNVQKVLWLLGELGLEFEHRSVGGAFGGLSTPEFLAMNPHGRIPVLQDAGLTVWESHSILRYLATCYDDKYSLWPATPAERSRIDSWLDWSQTALQPDFMALFWRFYRTPEGQRNEDQIQAARLACDRRFRFLDNHLSAQPFIAGDVLTLADIPAGAMLYRYLEIGLPVPRHAHVIEWYGRLAARPAYQRYVMVSFSDLYGRLDF